MCCCVPHSIPLFYDCQFGAFLPEKVLFLRIEGYIIEQKQQVLKGMVFIAIRLMRCVISKP